MDKGMNGPMAAQENERLWKQWLKDVADGVKAWPMKDGKVVRSQLATEACTGLSRNGLYGKLRPEVDAEILRIEEQERLRQEALRQAEPAPPLTPGPGERMADSGINAAGATPEPAKEHESAAVRRLREELAREKRTNDKLRKLLSEARAANRKVLAENKQYRHELASATCARRWWSGQTRAED